MEEPVKSAEEVFAPLFESGCRSLSIQRYYSFGADRGWRFQVFTDRCPSLCTPATTLEGAVKNAMERVLQS